MLCEKCKIREANVFYTEIIDGDQKNEHHLCSQCAKEIDQYSGIFDRDFSFSKILSGILGDIFDKEEKGDFGQIVCPTCNTGYDDFVKNSTFGCKDCFEVFNLLINDNIKQIHGNDTHIGKIPKNYQKNDRILPKSEVSINVISNDERELENLKHALEDAIKREDYGEAALLRDRIKTAKEGKSDVV